MDARHATAPLALCGIFALTLGLSACGNSSLSSGEATASSAVPSETKAAALAAMVPAKIKSAGKIVVGVDASYAPNEFLASDGTTVKGMDVDLFNAVGQTLGLKVDWQPAKFDSIITGVQGGKYDVGVSSFTINPQRKQQVNMVSYFNAGTQWATAPGNPKKINTDSPCGIAVAVQKGTVQQEQDLPVKVAKCKAAGKPINTLVYTGQDQVTAAVATGKADAMLADSPVVAYAVKQSGGKVEPAGAIYDSAPYGIVVTKSDAAFAKAIAGALKALDTSGGYKKILASWGNQAGAASSFAVNP
jgi:polar amino acid transport system substrate-binding protein